MVTDCADMEIALHRHESNAYSIDFRFSLPDAQAEVRLGQGQLVLARFDMAALDPLRMDPAAYGAALTRCLFADPALKLAFAQALAAAQTRPVPARLRLMIGPGAPELHRLHWETLQNPLNGSSLTAGGSVYFSRYLSSQDWRPILLSPRGDLRALVTVASPDNAARYGLPVIDRIAELQNARAWLGQIQSDGLPEPGLAARATLDNIITHLQETPADILYLVCHGRIIRGEPKLVLEDAEGQAAFVNGNEFVERLDGLERRPGLVVLVSCESAGREDDHFLASLGPQLAEHGTPAVIAMQGSISFDTISRLMPAFFRVLQKDGLVDRSLAIARGFVRERMDGWMPALFMRLKNGCIWETLDAEPPLDTAMAPLDTAMAPLDTAMAPLDTAMAPLDTAMAPLDAAAVARLSADTVDALVTYLSASGKPAARPANELYALVQSGLANKASAREALEDLENLPADPDAQASLRSQLKKRLAEDAPLAHRLRALLERARNGGPTNRVSASNRGVAAGGNISGTVITGDISGGVNIGRIKEDE